MGEINFQLVLGIATTVIFIFLLFLAFKPIGEKEQVDLAKKLRKNKIKNYFPQAYHTNGRSSHLKRHMNPKGGFFETNLDRHSIASEATRMLKYKKHEWIIFAFEKNKIVELIWTNKGDKRSVRPLMRTNQKLNLARKKEFETIYIFHNHPPYTFSNSDYIRLIPSKQDLRSAKYTSEFYQDFNINIAEYVCANRGYSPYYIKPKEDLFPLGDIIEELEKKNNSRIKRIGLWFKIWLTKDVNYISLE